jgi:type I restriction enzyme S subunit
MSEIPESWLECKLGDVTEYGTTDKVEPEAIPDSAWILELEDIEKDTSRLIQRMTFAERKSKSTKNRFRRGDVLYGKLRPYLNKVIRAPEDGFATTEIVPIPPNDCLDGDYLFYWLKHPTFTQYVNGVSHGLNMPRLGTDAGKKAPFVLAPIVEQKRIAIKLDSLLSRVDRCRERLDRVSAILSRFRQSVLAAATSGRLTEDWRERNGVSLESWSSEPLGDLLSAIESGINVKCTERPPQHAEKGLVKISAVTWGAYNDDESKTLPVEIEIPASTRIQIGDFLISRANTLELVGACVIVDRVSRPVYLSDKVLRLVIPEELKLWILYFLRSADGRKQIETLASGNQLSMRNISQANLRSIMIKLPPPSEREEIICKVKSLLDSADRLGRRYEAAHKSTVILTPSFLAKAFRGDLVPQDPDDEPASVLLERIREQRQTSPANKPKRPPKRTPRAPRKKAAMTKSRFDDDVQGKPYLAGFLKGSKKSLSAEDLFKKADLPLVDFYKQLDFEVKQELIVDRDGQLEAA